MAENVFDFLNTAAILTVCRLENKLSQQKERFHAKLTRFVSKFESIPAECVADYLENDLERASLSKKRYWNIIQNVSEFYRPVAETLLDLSILYAIFPESREALREAGVTVSIETAYYLEIGDKCPASVASALFSEIRPVFLPTQKANEWYAEVRMYADCRLIRYLAGDDTMPEILQLFCSIFSKNDCLPPRYLSDEPLQEAMAALEKSQMVLHIRGDAGSGKRFLLKHTVRNLGMEILFVDFSAIAVETPENAHYKLSEIQREAMLYHRIVCWYHVKLLQEKNWNNSVFARLCIQQFIESGIRVCCCSDISLDFTDEVNFPVHLLDIPALTKKDRQELWKNFCEREKCYSINPVLFAMRYKFSCSQIASVFMRFSSELPQQSLTEKERLERICTRVARPSERLFKISRSKYQLSDLKLPKREKAIIMEICANFQYSHKVYTEWGMQSKFPYGRSVSVLLSGPPGTGKTMTAHIIANQLGLPLFHAEVSQITDKYIGETEKHLEAIFSEAEKSNCVLLLDEADAICGKRSEVTDSKDRYANNDTAFLLQRLERYDGIVILATNFVNNLDDAFMRRMKYILQFSIPNAEIRKEIWYSCFPEQLPVSSDLDFDYLAEQFAFAGANIKNIVLAASFLAASENQPVNMYHILRSIDNEYLKFQKHILPGEFGKYSEMYMKILEEWQ